MQHTLFPPGIIGGMSTLSDGGMWYIDLGASNTWLLAFVTNVVVFLILMSALVRQSLKGSIPPLGRWPFSPATGIQTRRRAIYVPRDLQFRHCHLLDRGGGGG